MIQTLTWNLVFHLYNDNHGELPRVKELAMKHRLHLVVLPAIFMPCEKVVEKKYTQADQELISHLLETPEDAISRMKKNESYCFLWRQVTLDANADVYLCQLVYEDRFKLQNFLTTPLAEIQQTIRNHSFCGKCMKAGGQVYQACYSEMEKYDNPVQHANVKRHFRDYELANQ